MTPGDDRATIGFALPAALSAVAVRYELHAEIGRGGMGIVYKARDRRTGDLVAIKVIHPSIASDRNEKRCSARFLPYLTVGYLIPSCSR